MKRTQKFCEITTLDLSYVVMVKPTVEILQNFVVFSECMNFHKLNVTCITFPADLLNSNKISSLSEAHCPGVNFYFISEKKCQILAWDDTLHMSESNWESLLVYKAD